MSDLVRPQSSRPAKLDTTKISDTKPRTAPPARGTSLSPKKVPKNGVTSPLKGTSTPEPKKLPPIKAPVGNAPPPDLKNVKSKIGSLSNIKHKPKGSDVKVESKKLEWNASPRVGSLDNAKHKPGGGDKKIVSQKIEVKARSKIGSLDSADHKPGGGNYKVETKKLDFRDKAQSKVGSMDNVKHQPGGGHTKIMDDNKIDFKERAASKIGSLPGTSETGDNGHQIEESAGTKTTTDSSQEAPKKPDTVATQQN